MKGVATYKPHLTTAVPQMLEVRLEIAEAIDALATQDDETRRSLRQTEIAALRCELGEIALALQDMRRNYDPRLRSHVIKYSPDQPRVPAGYPDGGEWTSEGAGNSSGGSGIVFAQNKVTLHGFTIEHLPGGNPLDPQGLNKPISADEQQKIADALALDFNGDTSGLQPHPYGNLPHHVTGAVLPESTAGYTAYDVLGLGPGRGEGRLVIDNATRAIYYTNNHYFSFYAVNVNVPGE